MRLSPADHPWLADPAVRRVAVALHVAKPGAARFVGGCVRNAILDRPVDDLDMAVALSPDRVVTALETAGVKVAPTGFDHGTVTAIIGGRAIEITSLRADVKTDGRHAEVVHTEDWNLDWRRRDFTMNALYCDIAGAVWDAPGTGVADAQAGRVRFIGEAETRIREDYLRILRFFRFLAWYGRGEVSDAGMRACVALKDGLSRLSAERVAKELLKLLSAADPGPAVALMVEGGIWAALDLPDADLRRFQGLIALDRAEGAAPDGLLRLAALLPESAGADVAARLKLSKAQTARLSAAAAPAFPSPPGAHEARVVMHHAGVRAYQDRLRLSRAGAEEPGDPAWRAARDIDAPPAFPLTGADALAAGLSPGPEVGALLRRVEEEWVAADFAADARALRDKLHARAAEAG